MMQTKLSYVDGELGILGIAGANVEAFAFEADFEDICLKLWHQAGLFLGSKEELREQLGLARVQVYQGLGQMGGLKSLDPLAAMLSLTSQLKADTTFKGEILLTAAMPVFAAAWYRTAKNTPLVEPDPTLNQAQDFMRMALGRSLDRLTLQALNTYLVTIMDHGMNPSTYVARIIASTGSDLISAVAGAIAALKGPLHGGAPSLVLDMFDAIGEIDHAKDWIENALRAKRKIMGMGHAVYRLRDPRATVFEKTCRLLCFRESGMVGGRLEFAKQLESIALEVFREEKPNSQIHANVEFYTAVLLDAIGIPRELFTPLFGVGRVVGWCAHVHEQNQIGKLVRPEAGYYGDKITPVP
jgi:citrate synthase